MKQKNILILAIVWLLVMVSVVASALTLLASGKKLDHARWVSRQEYEMIERYSRLEEIRSRLSEGYFQEVSEEELLTGAMKGMMASVDDPYTFYYSPEEMEKHNQQSSNAYHGVGLLIQNNNNGYIEVIRVYEGGPAHKAGIRVGDWITAVNGSRVSGRNPQMLDEAVSLMKGKDGSDAVLTILRGNVEHEFVVSRGNVNVSNVSWQMLDEQLGYISIFQFTGDDVTGFERALEGLQNQGCCGLIIDLRNNPGGLLDDVVAIADSLLPEGVIVYTEDRYGCRENFYSDESHVELPIVVLVNEMSASAAEILAAAVQDFNRGTIVGEKTYGKGIVQTLVQFEDDGSGMQYTSSSYFTPSGKSIHGVGVTPDMLVDDEGEYASFSGVPDLKNDMQLRVAVDTLTKELKEAN